ncbi:MAG: hypothetical protein JWM41_4721 [Gemmatimonadetes bacterium]|nr:hypothetical protein [Gemmatimonadota bacterium]
MPSPTLEAVRASGGLSLTAISRLERRFTEALRHVPSSRVNLRLAVRHVVTELEVQDVSSDVVRRFVRFVADHHPERDDLDRTSMVTGERESDRVVRQMMEWVDELNGP